MHAGSIIKLLEQKYSTETFISECKVGSTYDGGCPRMDFWVAHKTWGTPTCTGFEVKVARSDFLKDNKWQSYLPYCQAFYFVSPAKVIHAEEVPAEAGLLWTSTNGTCLFTKKKAPTRRIQVNPDVYHYVLMHRLEQRRTGLLDHDSDERLVYASKVRQRIKDHLSAVGRQKRELDARQNIYDVIDTNIRQLGCERVSIYKVDEVAAAISRVMSGQRPVNNIKDVTHALRFLEAIERHADDAKAALVEFIKADGAKGTENG